jgi:hypothetical protein
MPVGKYVVKCILLKYVFIRVYSFDMSYANVGDRKNENKGMNKLRTQK